MQQSIDPATLVVEEPDPNTAPFVRDYSLVGNNATLTVEHGLADADWYQTPVPKATMSALLERRNLPAIRDTVIWFGLLFLSGFLGYYWWGTWWAIFPFAVYGVIYASSSDSRWHESSHGTAFRTDWLNDALYEIASFMVMRESTLWRWSHTRHHSDTLVVGRDPEIAMPRPPSVPWVLFGFTGIPAAITYIHKLSYHCVGRLTPEEKTFVPREDWNRIFLVARVHVLIYSGIATLAAYTQSILPFMYIGLPNLYGTWLLPIYAYTQHAGLAENVLDHRANCRTVYMNLINRFLYWNMNYHTEHHMFPLVPYYNLPRLHEVVREDMPQPYQSIAAAYREIIPAVLKQSRDAGYYVRRKIPKRSQSFSVGPVGQRAFEGRKVRGDWVEVCASQELPVEDVCQFDFNGQSYALYRDSAGNCYATDGICTHGRVHLAGGLVKGTLIECPKHNGRFDIRDGSPARLPVCVGLKTYSIKEQDGSVWVNCSSPGGAGITVAESTRNYRVLSNDNISTFIKELILESEEDEPLQFNPGEYLQFNIPSYEEVCFSDFEVSEPYSSVWRARHVYEHRASNPVPTRRNYSLASNPETDRQLRFNIRIASPPPGQDCLAGVGSSYMWSLRPGDMVSAIGPFGDFHIKESAKEMIYIGGGAGMSPLRSHISYLFESIKTDRKVSFWYGARSKQELFYIDYFEDLANRFENFEFRTVLSDPLPEDRWEGYSGFVHQVVDQHCLASHACPAEAEYYICGPPKMMTALQRVLRSYGVPGESITFDEF